jgi:hypothetical protein
MQIPRLDARTTLVVAGVAVFLELLAMRFAGLGMVSMARSAEMLSRSKRDDLSGLRERSNRKFEESTRLRQYAHRCTRIAVLAETMSLVLALGVVSICAVARLRGERWGLKLLIGFLLVYLPLLLIVV